MPRTGLSPCTASTTVKIAEKTISIHPQRPMHWQCRAARSIGRRSICSHRGDDSTRRHFQSRRSARNRIEVCLAGFLCCISDRSSAIILESASLQ
jgi:hypothetical protein